MNAKRTWLEHITQEPSRDVEKATGISHTTITRAARAEQPPAHVVIAVARAYGYNTVTALCHAGILTPEEVAPITCNNPLQTIPSTALLQELLRREVHPG